MIPFLDLKKINALHADEIEEALLGVVRSGQYIDGDQEKLFAREMGEYLGVPHLVPVGSGLKALELIFMAYMVAGQMEEGDEVIVPANTYIASILAISRQQLRPVLVEPDETTLNIDFDLMEKHISPRTRAVMVVHLYGRAAWSEKLERLAEKYSLKIVEDNAQAAGAQWRGRKTGSLGDAAGMSFYPTKNFGALGDSGAIATRDGVIADIAGKLANYGRTDKNIHKYQGENSRMGDMQASMLRIKLKYLEGENERRRDIAGYYLENIKNPAITLPAAPAERSEHIWHIFPVRSREREALQEYLYANGIQTAIHYPVPPHKQECYCWYNHLSLPITEAIHESILSIPLNPALTDGEAETIVNALNAFRR